MQMAELIIWQCFKDSSYVTDKALRITKYLSLRRVMLIEPSLGVTWYLGDIVIPDNPLKIMSFIPRWQYRSFLVEHKGLQPYCAHFFL